MLLWEGEGGGNRKVGLVSGEAGLRSNSAGVQVANSQLARTRAAGAVAQRHVLLVRLPQSDGGPNVCGMHRCWYLNQHASQMSSLPHEDTYCTRGIVVEIGWISVGVDCYCASKQARESKTCHQVLHRGFSAELERTRIVKNRIMLPNERMSEGSSERRDRENKRCRETGTQQLCTCLLYPPTH